MDKDYELIRSKTIEYNGFVEDFYKEEKNDEIIIKVSSFIPIDNFDQFFNFILKNFKVKNSYVKNYKISIKTEINELDVIRQTIDRLNNIEDEAMRMYLSEQKINLLMRINNEKMRLVSDMKSLQSKVSEKMQKGEYAVFSIELIENKPFKFMSNEYKVDLVRKIKSVIESSIFNLLRFADIIPFTIFVIYLFINGFVIAIFLLTLYAFLSKFWLFLSRKLNLIFKGNTDLR